MTDAAGLRAEEFFAFMIKRETIRLNRAVGEPWPWTDDKILQTYKFTNVKRKYDRTTMELDANVYSKNVNRPLEQILLNCAIARYFGRSEFLTAIGWQETLDEKLLISTVIERRKVKLPVWTGAYMITNQGISRPKEEVVAGIFLRDLWGKREYVLSETMRSWSWKDMLKAMGKAEGFGGTGFMAKETILDTMFMAFWPAGVPSDWSTWCPAGPGARRGAARALGLGRKAPMTETKTLDVMLELFSLADVYWPKAFETLELHDIQFQLCEFDKYERARLGEGRPRNFYKR